MSELHKEGSSQDSTPWALFARFVKLGLLAFGGPAAHIALLHDELVRRRAWIQPDRFLQLLAITHLVPGPNSTVMAMNLGYARRGVIGVWIAGTGFILPGALIVLLLTWIYESYGSVPQAEAVLWGIRPVIIAVILSALWKLIPLAVTDRATTGIFAAAIIASVLGVGPVHLIVSVVLISGSLAIYQSSRNMLFSIASPLWILMTIYLTPTQSSGNDNTLIQLAMFFFKVAILLFGGGYVLVTFLEAEAVNHHGWITSEQLLDVLAISQTAPGPLLTAATGIGYLVAGPAGAAVATVSIFLPSFIFSMLIGRALPTLIKSPIATALVRAIMPVVMALILIAAGQLAFESTAEFPQLVMITTALYLLIRTNIHSVFLILLGGCLGWGWSVVL